MVDRVKNSNAAAGRYLDPTVLSRLSSLELIARAVVDGHFTGMHRSPYFGFSQEFAEYRSYNEGDDLRFIDWNVYARTDRMYIKRFHGETNTAITLLLDCSASMGYASQPNQKQGVGKLDYAKYIAATLSYLAKRQHDAAGLVLFDDQIRERIPPSSHPDTLYRLLAAMQRAEASSGTKIGASVEQLAASVARRGIVVVVSDFYCDPDELTRNLQPLVQRGNEVVLMHVLDAAEIDPARHAKSLRNATMVRDLESGEQVQVSARQLREAYPLRMAEHEQALRRSAQRSGADYCRVNTSKPLDDILQHYLTLRQQRR